MTLFKKITTTTSILSFFIIQLCVASHGKQKTNWQSPLRKDFFDQESKNFNRNKKRAASQADVCALSAALSSTSESAGSDALALLSSMASSQKNALVAFFNICTALTTPDSTNNNATPISVATPGVKLALSTGVITLLRDSYNYTLLHFCTLFSAVGGVVNATTDTQTPAATIISAIFSDLTESDILAALTKKDMWDNTPVHYAALAPSSGQEAVVNALMSGLTSGTDISTVICKKNKWGYTPLHYAATFAPNSNDMVSALCTNTISTTQKLAALAILDQWQATPLSYAALYKSSAFFNRTFWSGITASQKLTALQTSKALPWPTQTTISATASAPSVTTSYTAGGISVSAPSIALAAGSVTLPVGFSAGTTMSVTGAAVTATSPTVSVTAGAFTSSATAPTITIPSLSPFSYANCDSSAVDFQNHLYNGMTTAEITSFIVASRGASGVYMLFTPKFELEGVIAPTFLLAQ